MLLWLLVLACHQPPLAVPSEQVVLGWRLAPGMELAYDLRTTHTVDRDTVVREEVWHYLVRRVDDQGVFTLEGHLEVLDADILRDGIPMDDAALSTVLDEERTRVQLHPIVLSLSIDGRMDRLEAGSWPDALPHRLLALRLPPEPVEPGSRWIDTETARCFTHVAPPSPELSIAGDQRLVSMGWQRMGRQHLIERGRYLAAEIDTQAIVRPEDARFPALDIQGTAQWDLDAGRLASRSIHVSQRGGTEPEQSGSLQIELVWMEPRRAHRMGRSSVTGD